MLGYPDLTLDLTARTVRRGDAELSFTRIEFALLELLVRNAEQVLKYDVIMDRVWGYGEAPVSNALQVFVAFLRRKLEAGRPAAAGAQRARRRVCAAGRPMRIRLTLKARFVFDRFYRALSSRSAPGAGLGLAVVQEIALGHGGAVTAKPAPGGGAVMRLSIPGLRQPDALAKDHDAAGFEQRRAESASHRPGPGNCDLHALS